MTDPAPHRRALAVPLVPRARVVSTAGRRGRHVLGLAGASDWRRALIDSASSLLIAAAGTRLLRSSTAESDWPWPDATAVDTEAALAEQLPGLELLGAVVPRQAGRERLSLLACVNGAELVVIKLGRPGTGIEREASALRLLERDPMPCINTPHVIADGLLSIPSNGIGTPVTASFIVTAAVGLRQQRAAIDEPLRTFEHDLAERLTVLDRPAGTPAGHVPVHGDLTPWNLRRTPRGLALFDWEDAGWGPPGSDIASYRQACDTLPRRRRHRH